MTPQPCRKLEGDIAVYTARFETLFEIAIHLNIAPDVAEELVANVLLSALYARSIENIDAWLTGALKQACRSLQ